MLRRLVLLAATFSSLWSGVILAADEWTDGQAKMAAGVAALHVVNWAQHRAMAYSDRTYSVDGMKGIGGAVGPARVTFEDPDYGKVDRRFLVSAMAGAAVVHALPSEWRSRALAAGLVIEAGFVARQVQLGVGFRF